MKTFEKKIKESVPTLMVFQHAGDQDVVEVKYLIKDLKEQYGDRANIITYDCSHDGQLKVKYKLKEYPTWILYKKGQELMRESGRKTIAELSDMIVRALN